MTPSRWIHRSGIYNFARCLHSFIYSIIVRITEIDELIKMIYRNLPRVCHRFLTFNLKKYAFLFSSSQGLIDEREIVSCDLSIYKNVSLYSSFVVKSKSHPTSESLDGKSRYRGRERNFEKLHRVRRREEAVGLAIKCDERTCQLQAENLQRP